MLNLDGYEEFIFILSISKWNSLNLRFSDQNFYRTSPTKNLGFQVEPTFNYTKRTGLLNLNQSPTGSQKVGPTSRVLTILSKSVVILVLLSLDFDYIMNSHCRSVSSCLDLFFSYLSLKSWWSWSSVLIMTQKSNCIKWRRFAYPTLLH